MSQRKRIDEQAPLSWQDAPAMLTPPVAARVLGMHTNSIEKAMSTGRLPFTRVGRIRKITKHALAAHVGLTLNASGGVTTDADTRLATYAAELDAALALSVSEMLAAVQNIADRMKGEANK